MNQHSKQNQLTDVMLQQNGNRHLPLVQATIQHRYIHIQRL